MTIGDVRFLEEASFGNKKAVTGLKDEWIEVAIAHAQK